MEKECLCFYCRMSSHRHYWSKHTCCRQTVDRQSVYPLPPLISEPSLRSTAPTWNSLASLPGLPSGTTASCVCVYEGKTVIGICIHKFPSSLFLKQTKRSKAALLFMTRFEKPPILLNMFYYCKWWKIEHSTICGTKRLLRCNYKRVCIFYFRLTHATYECDSVLKQSAQELSKPSC